jgi:hypothetical protein
MQNSMLKMMMFAALVSLAPSAIGCSPVQSKSARLMTAPFPQYRTFSFGGPEASPKGFKSSPRTAEVEKRMQPLITAVLAEKGYAPAEAGKKGDMVVSCASGSRKGIKRPVQNTRGDSSGSDEEADFVEGAIVVDMFDGTNDGAVWHGAARAEVNPDKIDDQLLQRAVREVLAPFPVRAAPGPETAR